MIKKMEKALAEFIIKNPWKNLISFIFVFSALVYGTTQIISNYSERMWFHPDHPIIKNLNEFERNFGGDKHISVALYNPNGIFNQESLDYVYKMTEALWQTKQIIRVESLTNYNDVRADGDDIFVEPFFDETKKYSLHDLMALKNRALDDETLSTFFLGKEMKTAAIYANLIPTLGNNPNFLQLKKDVEKLIEEIPAPKGSKVILSGSAAVNATFKEIARDDNKVVLPILLAIILVLLFILFRSYALTIVPIFLIVFVVGMTFGIMGYAGFVFNSILVAIPGILTAICLADVIHIYTVYYALKNQGYDSHTALDGSMRKNFLPTVLTSVTTAISFFSLAQTDIIPVRDLGILSGIGALFCWVGTYFFVCPLMVLIKPRGKDNFINKKFVGTTLEKFGHLIHRHAGKIIIVFSLVSIASIYTAFQNKVDSDPINYFDKDVPMRQGFEFLTERFGGLKGINMVIDSGKKDGVKDPEFLAKVDAYINALKADPDIIRVRSILDIIKKNNRVLHGDKEEFEVVPTDRKQIGELILFYSMGLPQGMDLANMMTIDQSKIKLTVVWSLNYTTEIVAKDKEMTALAKKMGLNAISGGTTPVYSTMNAKVVHSYFTSMAMAISFVFLILFLVFRNFKISFLAMLPNIIPLAFGAALMTLLGITVDIGTSMVCAICLGIAVDDTIHFVSNYLKNLDETKNPREAIEKTLGGTGVALIATTILLALGFGSFVLTNFVPNKYFGVFSAIVLVVALMVDLIFLPAILTYGRKK